MSAAEIINTRINGKPTAINQVRCTHKDCPAMFSAPRPAIRRSRGDDFAKEAPVVLRKMEASGWTARQDLSRALCPAHVVKEKRVVKDTPALSVVVRPSTALPPRPPAPPVAAAPRMPTPAERRMVLDAVEEAYDTANQRYRGANRDAGVAAKINLPRAWVTEIREQFFGPERNENDARKMEMVESLGTRHAAIETRLLQLMTDMDTLGRDIKALTT